MYATITAAALGGGGYYYYQRTRPETIAPPSNEERKTVPASSPASASAPQGAAFTGGEQGFIDLKLESVEELNHNTKKFRFALPNKDDVSGLQIASALITKYKGPEMDKPVIRPYTPVSDEDQKGYIDFVVKRYPNGPMSEHLHSMEPNQRLDFKGPIPKYPLEPNKHDHIAMIAGGTGITPYVNFHRSALPLDFKRLTSTANEVLSKNRMYQLARAIFKNPADKTSVTLIYGNLTDKDILLKSELEDLENTYPQRFRAFYLVDKATDPAWNGGTGHVTKELLKTVLPEPSSKDNFKVFVCGPPGLYKAVSGTKKSPQDQGELTGMLKELGYGKEQVYKF